VRIVKLLLLSLCFLFIASLAVSILIPSHIRISKAININGNKDSVYKWIIDSNYWKYWNPAFIIDSDNKHLTYPSIISRSTTDSSILLKLQQNNRQAVLNGWLFYKGFPGSFTVQWYMDFHLKWYPWQKLGSLFYENTYGLFMENGLNNLKKKAENQ
jgi:hypothetical protein